MVEPHVSGGMPVMASGKEGQTVVISDFLGTTLGVVKGEKFVPTPMTAFGETFNREPGFEGFFTGKPYDSDLKAYTFLFRNYRPELGRWTAKDPAGFPDGGNNFAYAPIPTSELDVLGLFRAGTSYSGMDGNIPYTDETDRALARGAPLYFQARGFALSQSASQHCIDGTTEWIGDLGLSSGEKSAFVADAAFNAVRQYVSARLQAGQHTFNPSTDHPAVTFGGETDLAYSIHQVEDQWGANGGVHLSGTITGTSGYLTVSFSDLYDFNVGDDYLVRAFVRLGANDWLSAFNISGSWNVFFAE